MVFGNVKNVILGLAVALLALSCSSPVVAPSALQPGSFAVNFAAPNSFPSDFTFDKVDVRVTDARDTDKPFSPLTKSGIVTIAQPVEFSNIVPGVWKVTVTAVKGTDPLDPARPLVYLSGEATITVKGEGLQINLPLTQTKTTPVLADTAAGDVPVNTQVALTTNTPGAIIHFTLDGTEPTEASPVPVAQDGRSLVTLMNAGNVTLRAKAFKTGLSSSETLVVAYNVLSADKAFAASPDLLQNGSQVTLSAPGTIRFTTDNSTPTLNSTIYTSPITLTSGVPMTIKAFAAEAGKRNSPVVQNTFTWTAVQPTVATPAFSVVNGATILTTDSVSLSTSTLGADIYYTVDGTSPLSSSTKVRYTGPFTLTAGNKKLQAAAILNGYTDSLIAEVNLTVNLPNNQGSAQTPAISPAAGSILDNQPLTLSVTDGSTIYYTTNGATPSTASTKYTAPFTLSAGTVTVKAIAVKTGLTDSAVLTATYTVTINNTETQAAAPVISTSANITTSQTIDMSTTTVGASIYYTIDGSNPTASSTLYNPTTKFTLAAGTVTVKAVAVKAGVTNSPVTSKTFTVTGAYTGGLKIHVYDYTHAHYWAAVPTGSATATAWPGKAMTADPTRTGWYLLELPGVTSINFVFSKNGTGQTADQVGIKEGERWFKNGIWTDYDPDKAVTPVITATPNGGIFNAAITVALKSANADDKIYYTLNGTVPTTASNLYSASITISPSTSVTTLKAFGVNRDNTPGEVATFTYNVNTNNDVTAPTVTSNVATGTYTTAQLVRLTLTDNKAGATAYYTTDGTQPTTSTITKFTSTSPDLNVNARTTINVLAVDAAGNQSTFTFFYNIGANAKSDFRGESIYFVITSRFYDGDTGNNVHSWDDGQAKNPDSDPAWRGDFSGLIKKLDYIKALGFSAVWITPVVENMSGYDYHGYHASNFKKVDARYLSANVTYQTLIDAVHAKGMKIIQDIVLNHTGNFGEENIAPLFKKDWNTIYDANHKALSINADVPANLVNIAPPGMLPANYSTLLPGAQFQARIAAMRALDTNNIYHHWDFKGGWETYEVQIGSIAGDCQDLNTENPTVYNYLIDAYNHYIDMGVDSFRVDTVKHISRYTFNKKFIPAFKARGGDDFYIFGEVCTRYRSVWNSGVPAISSPFYTWKESKDYAWSETDWTVNGATVQQHYNDNTNVATQPSSNNHALVNGAYHTPDYSKRSGFDVIDFPMHWAFASAREAYTTAVGGDSTYNDATWNVTYVASHDYSPDNAPEGQRFAGMQDTWAENLSLLFTFRGVPCVYNGDEVEFQKGKVIDVGPNAPLSATGRAYFGDLIEGTVNASDFGKYTASGTVDTTLKHPLAQHIRRLNLIRRAVPALQFGQYQSVGDLAFWRRYTENGIDSVACVSISGGATFSGIPNGTYVDAVTGDTKSVTNGTLTTSVFGKGNLRVYVKQTGVPAVTGAIGNDAQFQAAATKYMQ